MLILRRHGRHVKLPNQSSTNMKDCLKLEDPEKNHNGGLSQALSKTNM